MQRIGNADDPNNFYQFFYNAAQHDTNAKAFSFPIYRDGNRTIPARAASDGMQDGLDFINALARHPETARRIARKLWSFFINEIQQPPASWVEKIANVYLQSDSHMASVVRAVLLSREFDEPANYFARYSWPAEFVVRALKEVGDAGYPLNNALGPLTNMGQQLFEPPDVGGWSSEHHGFARFDACTNELASGLMGASDGDRARGERRARTRRRCCPSISIG